jgi:membrane protein insertase Oxa1/YidC/SpoIIIJ
VPQETITETTTVPITATFPVTTTETKTDTLTNTVYETKPYTTTVTSTTISPFTTTQTTQSVDFKTITETITKTLGTFDTGFVKQWYIPILLIIIAILSIMVLLTVIFYRAWKNRSKEEPSLVAEQEMVMVTCRYCGELVDITEGSICPRCGAKLL